MTNQTLLDPQEQALFCAGAERGYTTYMTVRQQQQLITPQYLYEMMMHITLDTQHLPVWNAGFLAGWCTAMCQEGDTTRMKARCTVSEGPGMGSGTISN
jgi:hypothetical protein